MLELSILAVIALAAVYWTALWLMGRQEDVLYGSFVTPSNVTTSNQSVSSIQPCAPLHRDFPPELPRRPRAALPAPTTTQPATTPPTTTAQAPRPSSVAPLRPAALTPPAPPAASTIDLAAMAMQANAGIRPQPAADSPAPPKPIVMREAQPVARAAQFPAPPAAPPLMMAQPKQPLAVNPAAVPRGMTGPGAPAAHQTQRTDVLASLLETIKRDLNEAARK
ncbi:hypothetical protein NP284_28795 [Rhodopseudomonas pseudopalustris]|uniref:Uncharacterized protein n=2 Tax=Rhodopseudomonas pseudopalustris TaxID=1513892 RepID=A0A1H8TSL0_9BRAD|nr:hypothetical protein SAMN05444123_10696 [Rhodopseudomonas pseudopalustris]